jgi:transcriptional regulator with XRE-family HTH domain
MADFSIIRTLCNERKITLKELSKRVGITEHGLQGMLKTNKARTDNLEKIAFELDIPISNFFGESDKLLKKDYDLQIRKIEELTKLNHQYFEEIRELKQSNKYYIQSNNELKELQRTIENWITRVIVESNGNFTKEQLLTNIQNFTPAKIFEAMLNNLLNQFLAQLQKGTIEIKDEPKKDISPNKNIDEFWKKKYKRKDNSK